MKNTLKIFTLLLLLHENIQSEDFKKNIKQKLVEQSTKVCTQFKYDDKSFDCILINR
jgi:hypothetical protein